MNTVGVIGCGLVGRKRALAADALGLQVVAAADLDRMRAEELIRAAHGGGSASTDWREVVRARPDLIVVATRHDQLAAIAAAAAEAGCHVLLEKPAARSAGELDPVVEAACRNNVTVKVGFNHRFHPAVRKARELVDAGELGTLMFVRGRYGHGGRIGYEREWRCDPAISGGGELIDQGSHLIDLSRWFLGEFTSVSGTLATFFWDIAVDDNCFLNLRTAQGQLAWLHASWTEWKNLFSFEIYGRLGKLHIDGLGGSYGVEQLTHYRMLPQMGPPAITRWEFPQADRSWESELAEFLAAIEAGRQPDGNIHDARANLAIIDQVARGPDK